MQSALRSAPCTQHCQSHAEIPAQQELRQLSRLRHTSVHEPCLTPFGLLRTRKVDHAHATMLTTGLVRLGDEERVCAVRTCTHHRRHRRNQLPALRCSRPGCAPGAPRPERGRRPPSEPPGTAGTAWWPGTGSCVCHHAPTFTSCAPPDSLFLSQCGGRCSRTLF